MSAVGFLILLLVSIVLLMILIIKVKLHPTFSLLITALVVGLVMGIWDEGFSFTEVLAMINNGFGGTLTSMGIPIILGAVLAMGVQDTGATKSIANFFIRLFKGKNLELAPALTAYVVSIPVFGDITSILTSNTANVLAKRKHISMAKMTTFTSLGLNMTHAMVPPTPGILAVSLMLGADLGMVISWGIAVTFVTFVIVWLLLRKVTEKEWIDPLPEIAGNIEEVKSDKVEDIVIKEEGLPGTLASFMTILIPVILIAGSSFVKMAVAEGSVAYNVANVLGDKVVALGLGVIYTMILGFCNQATVRKSNKSVTGEDPKSFKEIVFDSWVARGLNVALSALLITAMGGAFAQVIKSAPAINGLASLVESIGLPGLMVPFLVGAITVTAVGSKTTAGMTAAGIVLPMMEPLGLSPVACVLAIGAGTMIVSHVNDSGWWVLCRFFNLDVKQGLKYVTVPCAIAGVISFALIALFAVTGIM